MVITSSGIQSHIGLVREENQDSAGRFPEHASGAVANSAQVFAVADGMGGHRGGREASQIAIRILGEKFEAEPADGIPDRLRSAFEAANLAVRQQGEANPEFQGMGTTLTVMVFSGDTVCAGHVGDSRAYRISAEGIVQLTDDHSMVAEWLRKGWLTEEQARNHPERSLLYRALGVGSDISVDVYENIAARPGDRFLLCTDGLTNHVSDEEMLEIVMAEEAQEACERLVDLALERGGYDNITVQTIVVGP
ncbi:MAG: Stp1/IreP family PP2C-type Ser/Thr phosphatase [Ignavibacteria bacterium]|nr:Stp1/IreP family PP2C-type Ser/Thr phosphatase [Ignavibacteria bacterium]